MILENVVTMDSNPNSWNIFREGVQKENKGTSYIKIEKLRSKLDYVREILQLVEM